MKIFLLLLSLSSILVSGLFEDQMDEFDWHIQHVGKVLHAVYSPISTKYVYVATANQVIAKLNGKTGTIEWRNLLPKGNISTSINISHRLYL